MADRFPHRSCSNSGGGVRGARESGCPPPFIAPLYQRGRDLARLISLWPHEATPGQGTDNDVRITLRIIGELQDKLYAPGWAAKFFAENRTALLRALRFEEGILDDQLEHRRMERLK